MADFLLELRSEEIPARMQAAARVELAKLFRARMADAGLAVGEPSVWSSPRRLAMIARGLPAATEAVSEEIKGPRVAAPEQAIDGFLRKTGLTRDQLTERDGVWFALLEKPGRPTSELLADVIPRIVHAFAWPKSMRWGAASFSPDSLRWVRPLQGIVAILGEDLVECEVAGVRSGFATMGHRFHHPGPITIGGAHDYAEKLRACHVIVDQDQRATLIRDDAQAAAAAAGLVLVEDEGLVLENAGLTEWPVPLLGRFDPSFLEVPPEVIQLTARVNQKYFICHDRTQALANAFVCTANIAARDGGAAIVAGNARVLAARLADARFFWEQDRNKTLAQHAEGLARITFHEKLGSVADKVARVAKFAEWLASEGIVPGADPALARQAALLCKADLTTGMVGEFPELQGVMGGHYARAEGLPDEVADAIRDHYKPVGQGDDVPTAPVTVAVALADKLDTLVGFFGAGMPPTGSKDPFAIRRAALGIVQLIIGCNLRVSARSLANQALDIYSDQRPDDVTGFAFGSQNIDTANTCFVFLIDRLKVQQRELGIRPDLIDAVFALSQSLSSRADAWLANARPDLIQEDDVVRLLARVQALQVFVATDNGAILLAGYKRAANILKQAGSVSGSRSAPKSSSGSGSLSGSKSGSQSRFRRDANPTPEPAPEPAEAALIDALAVAEPRAQAAIGAEDFSAAMAALADLRTPIDSFFETVTVNADDPAIRAARLALLARFVAAVHKVADFSRIEG